MRQTTLPEQTAKLIGLGFKEPKSIIDVWAHETDIDVEYEYECVYSIGELIELLPQYLEYKGGVTGIPIDYYALTIRQNVVMYCDPYMDWVEIQCDDHKELIDNLYDMVVRLKEEGEI
jgi:hypothetical protein